MQDVIEKILEGNFEHEKATLDFSCSKIDLRIPAGEDYEGSFHIYANPRKKFEGYVYSSDLRMEVLTPEFYGSDEEIRFRLNGAHTEGGDVIGGSFYVVSNQGESYLPFVITVDYSFPESSIGPIKNLFHFANLAKTDYAEAVELFYSEGFKRIFAGNDAKFKEVYRTLSANEGNVHNVEEFLVHINKKQRVNFYTQVNTISEQLPEYGSGEAVIEKTVNIVRSGWGYTALNVECDGDFLFTEREFIEESDFVAESFALPVFIDTSKCHKGKNSGTLYIFNSHISIEIPVYITLGKTAGEITGGHTSRKSSMVMLMRAYLDYYFRRISKNTFIKNGGRIIQRMVTLDDKDMTAKLLQARLYILEERYSDAGTILNRVADMIEAAEDDRDRELSYHWYLLGLMDKSAGYQKESKEQIRLLYNKNKGDAFIGLLLTKVDEAFDTTRSAYNMLKKLYEAGSKSPLLYMDSLEILNSDPALLQELTGFELQVLNFGIKNGRLSEELSEQFLYLCARYRGNSPIILGVLSYLYENTDYAGNSVLSEICTYLIKNDRRGENYLKWYERGINEELRITNIYEYYMWSLNLAKSYDIPRAVLMYFSFQNNLEYGCQAYLYRYIIGRREEYPEIYAEYEPKLKSFVLNNIDNMRIDRNLSAIYQVLHAEEFFTAATAPNLSRLIFANRIHVSDDRLKHIYVYHRNNKAPEEYTIVGENTWISLYGNDYIVVFEDAYGNRFIDSVDYTMEKLMLPSRYVEHLKEYNTENLSFELYVSGVGRHIDRVLEEDAYRLKYICDHEDTDDELKNELNLKLIKYYYDTDRILEMDEALSFLSGELSSELRNSTFNYLLLRGKYEQAYNWLCEYGPYFADPKQLLKLLDIYLRNNEDFEHRALLYAADYCFDKGKYNNLVLSYLGKHYKGMTKNLRNIWKAGISFDMDMYDLCERMLIQMLYTGAFVGDELDIFKYYVSQGAREEVADAFLAQCAYDYFVEDRVVDKFIFDEIRNMYDRGEELQRVSKLAYLKFYAENEKYYSDSEEIYIYAFLKEFLAEKVHLSFFSEYVKHFPKLLVDMEDKTLVEYRAKPGSRARIHYMIVDEKGEGDGYLSEYMRDVYGGWMFKEFVLFYGETLQYYIIEEGKGEESLTESGEIRRNDGDFNAADSRYSLINDMLVAKDTSDYDTLDNLMEEYYRKEFYNERLFSLE